MLTLIISNY